MQGHRHAQNQALEVDDWNHYVQLLLDIMSRAPVLTVSFACFRMMFFCLFVSPPSEPGIRRRKLEILLTAVTKRVSEALVLTVLMCKHDIVINYLPESDKDFRWFMLLKSYLLW